MPADPGDDFDVTTSRHPARPVSAVFTTRQTTPLQVEVRPGSNDLKLRLDSRAR